ncbi:MAG: hypothetical protein JNM28_09385 [Armatimonadetes bacterium]|nr:hypothetical protein [Armatimonadota bacterium]
MGFFSKTRGAVRASLIAFGAAALAAVSMAQPRPTVDPARMQVTPFGKPGEVRPMQRATGRVTWSQIDTTSKFPQIARMVTAKGVKPSNPSVLFQPSLTLEEIRQRQSKAAQQESVELGSASGAFNLLMDSKFPGIGFNGSFPPDTHMAVGPTHIVQIVNTMVAFYNKKNGKLEYLQPLSASGFLPRAGDFAFDPRVVYDYDTNQFVICVLDVDFNNNKSYYHLAISDDSNPNGNWMIAKVDNITNDSGNRPRWGDYPTLTTSPDSWVCTFNAFPFANGNVSAVLFMIRKTDHELFVADLGGFSVSLAKKYLAGPGTPVGVMLGFPFLFGGVVPVDPTCEMVGLRDDVDPPTLTFDSVSFPVFVWQAEGAQTGGFMIDTIGDRMMDVSRTGDFLQFAFTCNNGIDADGYDSSSLDEPAPRQTKVRWGELRLNSWPAANNPTLRQAGDVKSTMGNGRSFLMPAISRNSQGSIAIVLTDASENGTPKVAAVGRKDTDPLGQMGTPQVFASSPNFTIANATDLTSRWGDYAGIGVDPSAADSFWASHEVFSNASLRWGTEIFKFRVKSSTVAIRNVLSVTPIFGNLVSGNAASFNALGDSDQYVLNSGVQTNRGNYAGYEAVIPTNGLVDGGRLDLSFSASIEGVSAFVYAKNDQTGNFDLLSSIRAKTTPTAFQRVFTTAEIAKYRAGGTGNMTIRVVLLNTIPRRGGVPDAFDFSTDFGQLTINEL